MRKERAKYKYLKILKPAINRTNKKWSSWYMEKKPIIVGRLYTEIDRRWAPWSMRSVVEETRFT
ncbi:MAG TPA: hypothetical protein VK465_12970, partial [Fibrobacteria bacterium]|nr:hypothetical protein [Fibrobacteria bacterium]